MVKFEEISLIFVSIGNAVSPYVSQNLGANKTQRIKKGYHAALVLDVCFAAIAFFVIETLHTQISSLFLGKDGTALAYQVSGDYMRWIGYFFIFMGIKMATDGVLRGLGIMRPFLIANMVNLAIRLSVALICAPRFGIDFVWLAVPAGWLANFLVSYAALRKSWPMDKAAALSNTRFIKPQYREKCTFSIPEMYSCRDEQRAACQYGKEKQTAYRRFYPRKKPRNAT